MTDFKRLKVSLTKHGAHKIALLLKHVEPDKLIDSLWGKVADIHVEKAQAKKVLSFSRGKVPNVWKKAKDAGESSLNALTFISIIFSHSKLIKTMIDGGTSEMAGNIIRGKVISAKEYTNFAHTIDELGYSLDHSKNHVRYDLSNIFQIPEFHKIAGEILTLKLKEAGWDEKTDFIDELISNGVHEVFALSAPKFANWLKTGELNVQTDPILDEEAIFFFADASNGQTPSINFKPGHNPKKTEKLSFHLSSKEVIANVIHNKIQNELFTKLRKEFGEDCVGTEIPTGVGTSIDAMVFNDTINWLYEIKTAGSVKTCIRQAIPQLLEYAYWGSNERAIDKLIIISQHKITPEAETYLEKLRTTFGLPLYYEQFNLNE